MMINSKQMFGKEWVQKNFQQNQYYFVNGKVDGCLITGSSYFINDYKLKQQMMENDQAKDRGRVLALIILIFQIAIFFAYGFGSIYLDQTSSNSQDHASIILYFFVAMLALLGYGLLIAYSKNGVLVGMITTLLVASIVIQLSPLWQKIWYSVFNSFTDNTGTATSGFQYFYQNRTLKMSIFMERVTMTLLCSLLITFTGFVGKIGSIQIFAISIIFTIGWTFSFMASIYLDQVKAISLGEFFDDYGTNYIYVFGSCFGLIVSLALSRKKLQDNDKGMKMNRQSVVYSLIGTGFIFATFPFTGIIYPNIESSAATYSAIRTFKGPLNIYFAMSASVICTYISSLVFGDGKSGIRQALVGTVSGGFSIAAVASFIPNIGACIAIGAFSGIFSGFWLRKIYPMMNKEKQVDALGLFGPILINSIIGGVVINPALISIMRDTNMQYSTLSASISSIDIVYYQLAYVGIAAGSGLFAGLISVFFTVCCWYKAHNYDNAKMVSQLYGLYEQKQPLKSKREEIYPSQQYLHSVGDIPINSQTNLVKIDI